MDGFFDDAWGAIQTQADKELDKAKAQAEAELKKRAAEETQKLITGLLPVPPAAPSVAPTPMPVPVPIANLASRFQVQPWVIYAGIAAVVLGGAFLYMKKRKKKA